MFVAQPTSAAGGGTTVVTTGGTTNGAGDGAGTNSGAASSYVIQGGYMLGSSSSAGTTGNSQNYSHTARASPATVSITEGEESSVPSADKKVCRGAKRRNFFSFYPHPHNPLVTHTDDVIVEFCEVESTIKKKCGDLYKHQRTNVNCGFCNTAQVITVTHDFLTVTSSSKKTKPWPHHFHVITVHVMRGIFNLPEMPQHYIAHPKFIIVNPIWYWQTSHQYSRSLIHCIPKLYATARKQMFLCFHSRLISKV